MIPLWAKILIVIALSAAIIAGKEAWESRIYKRGYSEAENIYKLREAKIAAEQTEKFNQAKDQAISKERELRRSLDAMAEVRFKKETQYEKTINQLRADARDGTLRLFVDAKPSSISGCAENSSSRAAASPGSDERPSLLPGVADNVLRIAGDTAKSVRDYNELLSRYNSIRQACNN